MSNKIFRNPFVYLGAEDGIILFRKKGVEVRYPSTTIPLDENVMTTMDYLRYCLERQDWQLQWHDDMLEIETRIQEEEEASSRPTLRLLTGGKKEDEES